MSIRSTMRRGLTAAAAVTAAFAVVLSAAPASADVVVPVGAALPDGDRTANLHVFKHESPATELPANGLPQNVTNPVVEGVEFTIRRHPDIDLTTREGWEAAQDLTVATFGWADGVDERVGVTDANGRVTFANLPLGLWMVQETGTPEGILPGAPFVVALPMTHPLDRDVWMYDVYVYPKNAVVDFTKTVQDADTIAVGDNVQWTITADVPHHTDDYLIDFFRIVDVLDERLAPVTTGTYAPVVSLVPATAGTLVEDTHFTIDWDATTREWTFDFTAVGRALLDTVPAGTQVQIVLNTTVLSVGDGQIVNDARFYPNYRSYSDESPQRSQTETRFGGILIEKIERGNPENVLAGATFQIFLTEEDAIAQTNPVSIVVDGVSVNQWTTDADGRVVINGLRLSNFENGAVITDPADWRSFWLVEIESPEGFELLAEPIQFYVTSEGVVTLLGDPNLVVENIPHNAGFRLPMTGSTGTMLLTIGGVVLLAAATGYLVVSSRKRQTA
ncbi:MAG: SpaH/EbpB family LPXTG-anchored major pilin [Promicromonosporaceae bacterium]|nr:SpaH/EbpB family LPXTG-anchored major pilin [Promicromonosporaceae bacterium]